MSDPALAAAWAALCVGGIAAVLGLRRAGLAATHARDLLHVGAGCWAFGLGAWGHAGWPLAITASAGAAALAVGVGVETRLRWAIRVRDALCGPGERWTGIVLYTGAYVGATAVALGGALVPAAAAILALAWGDGLGGFVGRRWGRHRFRCPWAKPKSWEGFASVVVGAGLGACAAGGWYLGHPVLLTALAAGLGAATAEGLAPRTSDNVFVPSAAGVIVWACLASGLR